MRSQLAGPARKQEEVSGAQVKKQHLCNNASPGAEGSVACFSEVYWTAGASEPEVQPALRKDTCDSDCQEAMAAQR